MSGKFVIKHVTSVDNPPTGDTPYDTGTTASLRTYRVDGINGLMRRVNRMEDRYGERAVWSGRSVGPAHFHWTWERQTSWGGRVSDTFWVRVINW